MKDHLVTASVYLGNVHRSSRPEVFCEKGVLRNFAKFTGKHLCQSLFFNKLAGLNVLRTAFFIEHLQWLHLKFFNLHDRIEREPVNNEI